MVGVGSFYAGSLSSARGRYFAVSFAYSMAMALLLAISAWLTLEANDGLFYSRLLPWIPSLIIWLQEAGFQTASRFFPCRYEGFDTGCEAYKILPVFVFSNTSAYLPFLLAAVFLSRYIERVRLFLRAVANTLLRWGSPFGVALLCVRLVLYRLSPDVSLPISRSRIGRMAWMLLDLTAGSISVAFALSIPFVLYGAIRATWKRNEIQERLFDLTRVAAFVLAALILGNQYQ